MKRILFTILTLTTLLGSMANAEVQVIQVKRNIPLSDDEPVYKDYYLSGGSKSGLRENLVVPVWRWVNLRENSQAQDQSMKILEPVGWLKIIFTQDQFSVARLYEPANYEKGPIFDQPGIMIGDIISLERSFMAKPNHEMPPDSTQLLQPKEQASSSEPNLQNTTSSQAVVISPTVTPVTVKALEDPGITTAGATVRSPAAPPINLPNTQEGDPKKMELRTQGEIKAPIPEGPKPASIDKSIL